MALRLLYPAFLKVLGWMAALPTRSEASKNAEILVLRHQLGLSAHRMTGVSRPNQSRQTTSSSSEAAASPR